MIRVHRIEILLLSKCQFISVEKLKMDHNSNVPFALETYGALSARLDLFFGRMQRSHLESVQDQGPPLACCAHGSVKGYRLHCNGR